MTPAPDRRDAWPAFLPPPGAPGWQHRAVAFLLDCCPPDYRAHDVIARQPAVLGWLAVRHVDASVEAARLALAQARAQLHDVVPPTTVQRLLPVLEQEVSRLALVGRQCRAVASALLADARAARLRAPDGAPNR